MKRLTKALGCFCSVHRVGNCVLCDWMVSVKHNHSFVVEIVFFFSIIHPFVSSCCMCVCVCNFFFLTFFWCFWWMFFFAFTLFVASAFIYLFVCLCGNQFDGVYNAAILTDTNVEKLSWNCGQVWIWLDRFRVACAGQYFACCLRSVTQERWYILSSNRAHRLNDT